ncbi:MAG: acyl carrier protein [Chitinophaga sp.]|uniref:acyl carrier protein n=1 Tax=Chitinophaga sp. TaxID=1869181 RepID=UPI0025BA28DD|nr:acyl carrier protein [Chitinophaga sp.]MBV8254343.1 acyl carrier protein [Chitinophaga sp.]
MSDINTFRKNFVGIFPKEPANLTNDTIFRSIPEWDSMAALALIAMLDDEYKIEVEIEELKQANTINELYSFVQSKS